MAARWLLRPARCAEVEQAAGVQPRCDRRKVAAGMRSPPPAARRRAAPSSATRRASSSSSRSGLCLGGKARIVLVLQSARGDQVIREDPAGAVVVRAWPGHRNIGRGSCQSALADGVERRSTAVVRGLSVHSRRRPNGSLRPVNRSPPPSASSVGVGRHRGSTWVRQFSPP